jgi:hypothetical protein
MAPLLFHLGIEGGRYGKWHLLARPPLINASIFYVSRRIGHVTFLHIFLPFHSRRTLCSAYIYLLGLRTENKHAYRSHQDAHNKQQWLLVHTAGIFSQVLLPNKSDQQKTRIENKIDMFVRRLEQFGK